MKTFETIYAFFYGVCDFCAHWYVRLFPPAGLTTVIVLLIMGENTIKQNQSPLALADGLVILAIIIILVLMSALWVILHLMEKLSESRPPRHYRKDVNK